LRTERPRKTIIGTEVAHVTRDLDTTFTVKKSKGQLAGAVDIVVASRAAFLYHRRATKGQTTGKQSSYGDTDGTAPGP